MSKPICQVCKAKESTGVIFAMCDDCFDAFEAKLPKDGSKYVPTDIEVQAINEPFIDRSKGN